MIDLDRIVGFDWDAGSARKSVDKHGISQAAAEQVFMNKPLLLLHDPIHSRIEPRHHGYGKTHGGRLFQVSFTLRNDDTLVRIISARPMSATERARCGKEEV
ncbi:MULTISPECIES: BrnT family toxin [Rhodopseudomonas]|uniref:BrnT family toxin n=1 Tax=Rhodopseudomonas palustris TaxID=1076 RepID=A0A0D7EDV7_RHOPL|nr:MULTISPECIES: BrnT family toxin [Rhodopseudomonas]KIZ38811.1 hypothetical protein OO17_22495 [Rhodopseudomonas palustris]MDF3810887.1 BrnT family toxin [Rhodopseudomonas sp. BAL398]WOK18260.1 BrnT family toxin [Rhodopseudomonas sp. BAL398]